MRIDAPTLFMTEVVAQKAKKAQELVQKQAIAVTIWLGGRSRTSA